MTKPNIVVIGTGGTIVSSGASNTQLTGYDITDKDVNDVLTAIPSLATVATISCVPICNIGSSNITLDIWLKLAKEINRMAADPSIDGFVITHGTDTMEETAFFLNLTVKTDKPVVLTGSMRPATVISADGPLNLLNAVRVAASKNSCSKGVLVCMNGQIHAARDVTKTNTVSVDTFASPCSGPLGFVIGEEVEFLTESVKPHTTHSVFQINDNDLASDYPPVSIVLSYAGEDLSLLNCQLASDSQGIVLNSFGNSTISKKAEEALDQRRKENLIIIRASRTGSGPVTEGKVQWQSKGFIPAGTLSAQKSRILLQLALKKFGPNQEKIREIFRTY